MRDVVQALIGACSQNGAVLAVVTEASGSSPRGTGALMAVGPEGRLAGSVGGGALELEAIGQAQAHLLEKKNGTAHVSLREDTSSMVCGGDVKILYAYLPPHDDTLRVLALADACLQTHTAGRLILPYEQGIGFMNERNELIGLAGLAASAAAAADGTISVGGRLYYVLPLGTGGTVHILGGGHLGQALAHLLPWLDFAYDVTDDREDYAEPALFPGAQAVRRLAYTDLSPLEVHPEDYIVIVTEGHQGDYAAEKWALGTPALYIGAVGSAAKTAYVRGLLEADGFSPEELGRITAPIGIPIGSDTPEEIAVSIAAQLISVRSAQRRSSDR